VPLVTYSALRLGLLAACFGLGYLAGLRTWLLLAVAVLAAWGLSYVLLARPRDAAAAYLAERVERRRSPGGARTGADEDAAEEDALVERAQRLRDAPTPDADRGPASGAGYAGETASPRPSSTP
jgi:Protein of unknown function (DUF4229)